LRKTAQRFDNPSKSLFDGFQDKFSDLSIELYQDVDYLASSPVTPKMTIENLTHLPSNFASSTTDTRLAEDQMENAMKNAVALSQYNALLWPSRSF
jgi:hypothetical protein